ncbi:auxilin-like protein 1 [Hevea brasiliensis]|uniref:auxilin-like protein 1 n=1 Tax=Hevea brasiliensis TaxID=3981 RepID=UPI0025CEE7DF|nr:auxilin-like protein 1 [Hevea brasiliensis]
MENLSHSRQLNMLSKKSCNGDTTKSIYEDVFGGPPRFGTPTLSPRVEDYSEIFGGFRASRASSIPVLDLPLVDEAADVFFDVRSSGFDYGEVFGGFNGCDFAVSYNELLMMEQSNGLGDDSSSDEAWAPAEAEILSDESNHSAKDQCLLNGDSCDSIDGDMEFNLSYNKVSKRSNGDLSNGITHITQPHSVSGYTFVVHKTSSWPKTDYEYQHMQASIDDHLNIHYSGEMLSGRHLRKVMSQPANGTNTDVLFFGDDVRPHKEFVRNGSLPNEMFVTISDVSLRTQPSHLPPPSRPPPALDIFNGDSGKTTTNCKSVASEETTGDSSPPYFDVEVDASSSAAASAAAMKEAMEKAQAKLKSAKESMERKKDGFQNRVKSCSKSDRKDKGEKLTKIGNGSGSRKEERGQGISQIEENGMEFSILKEMQKVKRTTQPISDSLEGKKHNVANKSAEDNHGRESSSSRGSDGDGEWTEATQFFELVTNNSRKAFDQENNENILVHNSNFHEYGKKEKRVTMEALQRPQRNDKKVKAVRTDYGLVEYEKKSEESMEAFEQDKSSGRSEVVQKGLDKKVQVAQEAFRWEGNEKKYNMGWKPVETEKQQTIADDLQKHENSVEVQQRESKIASRLSMKHKEKGSQLKEDNKSAEDVKKFTGEKDECERREIKAFELEENEKKLNVPLELADNDRRLKKALEQEEKEKMIKAVHEWEENEKIQREAYEREEHEKILRETLRREEKKWRLKEALEQEEKRRLKETYEKEERFRRQREAVEWEENNKIQRQIREREENEKRQREALESEENEKRLKEAQENEENERKLKETFEKEERQRRLREAVEQEENVKREREAYEREENEKRLKETLEKEENERGLKAAVECEENERRQRKAYEREENEKREAQEKVESEKRCKETSDKEKIEQEAGEREVGKRLEGVCEQQECMTSRWAQEAEGSETALYEGCGAEEIGTSSQVSCKWDETEAKRIDVGESGKRKALSKNERKNKKLEVTKEIANEETCKIMNELRNGEKKVASGIAQGNLEHEKSQFLMEDATDIDWKTIGNVRSTFGVETDIGNQGKKLPCEKSEKGKNIEQTQASLNPEINKVNIKSARAVKESIDTGRKMEGAQPAIFEVKVSTPRTAQQVNATRSTEIKVKNSYETISSEDKEAERTKREREMEKEHLRKMEEEREREREREKDRMAVDRAALDTRERAYAEARERAEWAAVERATAEARQRALNEACERLEKVCAEVREKSLPDMASMEARLRAERAAVERATAEARERAFEKAMAERASSEAGEQLERSVLDKLSASSRTSGMRASSSSSDLQDLQSQGSCSFSGSRYQHSSICNERFEEVEGESAQRYKARLERHRRTAERAAKALAEKNMRDLSVQKEQAERNRLAETLDADVKRWSSGKEGNLRALLSTLQYILGPGSGWQPIPLTEVITAAAVKKAYRKATLCVHPDKLQQRGASIQQKYICEKVFDLLKEAWNKFNSEER